MNLNNPEKEFVFDLRLIEKIMRILALIFMIGMILASALISGKDFSSKNSFSHSYREYESKSPLFDEVQSIMASSPEGAKVFGNEVKISYEAGNSEIQFETNKTEGTLIFNVQGSKASGKIKVHWTGDSEVVSVIERQILPPDQDDMSFSFSYSEEKQGTVYHLRAGAKIVDVLITNNNENKLYVDKIELLEKGDGTGIIFEKG